MDLQKETEKFSKDVGLSVDDLYKGFGSADEIMKSLDARFDDAMRKKGYTEEDIEQRHREREMYRSGKKPASDCML